MGLPHVTEGYLGDWNSGLEFSYGSRDVSLLFHVSSTGHGRCGIWENSGV